MSMVYLMARCSSKPTAGWSVNGIGRKITWVYMLEDGQSSEDDHSQQNS